MTRVCSAILGLLLAAQAAYAQTVFVPPVRIEIPAGGQAMPQLPPRDNAQPPKPGKATIRGHVVAADTGQPLRKAQVRISSNDSRENRMTTTDADGRYEFKELPAGRYSVQASKGSYFLVFNTLLNFDALDAGRKLDAR